MKRAEALLAALLLAAPALAAPPPAEASPEADAFKEVLAGSPLSERQRTNKVKRFREILGWHRKDREKLLEEGRKKVLAQARRTARQAMEAAFARAGNDSRAVEARSRQAENLREDWVAMRKDETPEAARLRSDPRAQETWVHRRGFTREGMDATAAAFIFSDERCVPLPPPLLSWLKGKGLEGEEAAVLILAMDIREHLERRMGEETGPSRP